MFRFLTVALVFFGLGALIFGGSTGAAWLVFAPVVIVFKILFFMFLFGMISKLVFHRGAPGGRGREWGCGRREWTEWTAQRPARGSVPDTRTEEDRFNEWHSLYHARKEVDSWTSDLPDADQNA